MTIPNEDKLNEELITKIQLKSYWWENQSNFVGNYLESIATPETDMYLTNFFMTITSTLKGEEREDKYSRDEILSYMEDALDSVFDEEDV